MKSVGLLAILLLLVVTSSSSQSITPKIYSYGFACYDSLAIKSIRKIAERRSYLEVHTKKLESFIKNQQAQITELKLQVYTLEGKSENQVRIIDAQKQIQLNKDEINKSKIKIFKKQKRKLVVITISATLVMIFSFIF